MQHVITKSNTNMSRSHLLLDVIAESKPDLQVRAETSVNQLGGVALQAVHCVTSMALDV